MEGERPGEGEGGREEAAEGGGDGEGEGAFEMAGDDGAEDDEPWWLWLRRRVMRGVRSGISRVMRSVVYMVAERFSKAVTSTTDVIDFSGFEMMEREMIGGTNSRSCIIWQHEEEWRGEQEQEEQDGQKRTRRCRGQGVHQIPNEQMNYLHQRKRTSSQNRSCLNQADELKASASISLVSSSERRQNGIEIKNKVLMK
jgi:hypothetical protein